MTPGATLILTKVYNRDLVNQPGSKLGIEYHMTAGYCSISSRLHSPLERKEILFKEKQPHFPLPKP